MALPVKRLKFPDGTSFDLVPANDSEYAKTQDIPKKLSELQQDSSHEVITAQEREKWNEKMESYEEQDPTVPDWAKQPQKPTYTAAEVGALPENTYIPPKYDDTNLIQRITALENKMDKDTIYDDTVIKDRLTALERKEDKDTLYDDTAIRERLAALESKVDNDTIYDDSALVERIIALEKRPDKDTVYDDTAIVKRIRELEKNRPIINVEEGTEVSTYDDTELVERITALEQREDKDTIYDDSAIKSRLTKVEGYGTTIANLVTDNVTVKKNIADLSQNVQTQQTSLTALNKRMDDAEAYEGDGFLDAAGPIGSSLLKDTYGLPDYSAEIPNTQYKLGYNQLGDQEAGEIYMEAYRRVYNAITRGHDNWGYKYYTDESYRYSTIARISMDINGTFMSFLYVSLSDLELTVEEITNIILMVHMDYPDILWKQSFTESPGASIIRAITDDGLVSYVGLPYYTTAERNKMQARIDKTFKKICNTVYKATGIVYYNQSYAANNKAYSEKEKVRIAKVIHDYLVLHNDYGETTSEASAGGNQIAWSAMSEGEFDPVCAGYAQAFNYCCWLWGITSVIMLGTSRDIRHAWNMVTYKPITLADVEEISVNKNWQYVDTTWDDPVFATQDSTIKLYCSWEFFNQPGYVFDTNHTIELYHPGDEDSIGVYYSYPAHGSCTTNIYRFDANFGEGGVLYYF